MRVLTTNGRLTCIHGGLASCSQHAQSFVDVQGHAVLIGPDPLGRTMGSAGGACPIPNLPCVTTLAPSAGHSTFVSIGGVPVCLDTITGINAPSGGGYSVHDPGQAFVEVSA